MHVIAIMVAEIKHATIHACYVMHVFSIFKSMHSPFIFFLNSIMPHSRKR